MSSKKGNPKQNSTPSEVEKWRNIYRILFPQVPKIPSPCKTHFPNTEYATNRVIDHDAPRVDPAEVQEITQGFCQYFKEKFAHGFTPDYNRNFLIMNVDEIVQRNTDAILSEYREMRLLHQAASLESPSSSFHSRKRRRSSASPTMKSEAAPRARQKTQYDRQPRATDSNPDFQNVAPQADILRDLTTSSMPELASQPQPDSFVPNNAPFTWHMPTDLGNATNEDGYVDQFSLPVSVAPESRQPYPPAQDLPSSDWHDIKEEGEQYRMPQDNDALFDEFLVMDECLEPLGAASTETATGPPVPMRTPAPIVPSTGLLGMGIGFREPDREEGLGQRQGQGGNRMYYPKK
jgi:hypothetical protein